MITGIVKEFDPKTGFGFLTCDDNGADVFIHISEVERCGLSILNAGQKLSFETIPGRNGFDAAQNVKLL